MKFIEIQLSTMLFGIEKMIKRTAGKYPGFKKRLTEKNLTAQMDGLMSNVAQLSATAKQAGATAAEQSATVTQVTSTVAPAHGCTGEEGCTCPMCTGKGGCHCGEGECKCKGGEAKGECKCKKAEGECGCKKDEDKHAGCPHAKGAE